MPRKIYHWKLRTTELQLGERTLIMGVLNATPDSFSDGGLYNDPDRAYARALEMEEQGADIIDLGAESTRPGSKRITADEEWQRLVPILKKLQGKLRIPLSLDTYKHETAERAMEYGVEIINDPSGLTFDAELAKVAANHDAGLILNHMRGTPETWAKLPPMPDVAGMVGKELEACANRARHALVEKNRIVLDPGLGFGKRKEQNAEILAHLGRLAEGDYPILIGASRKSFLAQGTEGETAMATAAAVTVAIMRGAHIVRVHDVAEMRAVAAVADEISRYGDGAIVEEEEKPKREYKPRKEEPRYGDGEKAKPTRPPLAIRKLPPAAAPAEAPPAAPAPREEYQKPEYQKKEWKPRPAADGPRDDRRPPSRPAFRPQGDRPSRPAFRNDDDRPSRPAFRNNDDRPSRPAFRNNDDRPSRPAFRKDDDRPARPAFRNNDDRPSRPAFRKDDDRPSRPAFRPQGDRPSSRPPARRDDDRGPRPPFRGRDDDRGGPPPKRPAFRPGGDRPQSGPSGPPRGGPRSFDDRPPRGGSKGPSKGGPPAKRPFRKRP